MVLNNSELNAKTLRKAFDDADLGVVCVRDDGFIKSDSDGLCHLLQFDDGFECVVYDVLYSKDGNEAVYRTGVMQRRFDIINLIYTRWLALKPHKCHTASPFANSEFVAYLIEQDITEADYILISKVI